MSKWIKTVEKQTKQEVGVYTNANYDFVFRIAPHNALDGLSAKDIDQWINEYHKQNNQE